MTNLKQTIKDQQKRNREEWGIHIGPKSNQRDQNMQLDIATQQTAEAVLAAVVEMVEGKKYPGQYAHDGGIYSPNEINAIFDDLLSQLKANQES